MGCDLESQRAVGAALAADRRVFVAPGHERFAIPADSQGSQEYGCLAAVMCLKSYVQLELLARARVMTRYVADGVQRVQVEVLEDSTDWGEVNDPLIEALALCGVYLTTTRKADDGLPMFCRNRPGDVVDTIADVFPLDHQDKLRLLNTPDLRARLELLTPLLQRHVDRLGFVMLPSLLNCWRDTACSLLPLESKPRPPEVEMEGAVDVGVSVLIVMAALAVVVGSLVWFGWVGVALPWGVLGLLVLARDVVFDRRSVSSIRCTDEDMS